MLSKKLIKHRRLLTYALLAFLTTSALSIGITPQANASPAYDWQPDIEQKLSSNPAPIINKNSDLPQATVDSNYKPEQTTNTGDKFYQRCFTQNACTLREWFSNTWNNNKKIFFRITNPNPDYNPTPEIDFNQKPITNPANTNQIKYNIKLPANFPNGIPASPYNMQRCLVFIEQTPNILGTACQGINWVEGESFLPATDFYYSFKNIGFGSVGVIIKSCFNTCTVVASATIDNQGQLPPGLQPEPQPDYEEDNEPVRRLRVVLQCRDSNGTVTAVTKYSDTYLHSQTKTAPIDMTCPANTRIIESKLYEETYYNNTWQNSPQTNVNNEPGLIGVATYPPGTISPQNEDANCVTGKDTCRPDVVVGSGNGAVSCFNNASLCQDINTQVIQPIKEGTYNPQTQTKYTCIYNAKVKAMEECIPIFPVILDEQSNIGNNIPGNFKSIEDVKKCAPSGLQILNPLGFVVSLGCVLEVLFIPSTNAFYEKVQQAYYTETPLPQIATIVTGFISPVTNAKTALNNNYCQGLDIVIPLQITEWGATPGKSTTVFLFAACDGITKKVSDIWLPLANSVVYFSGFILGLNIYLRAFGMKLLFKGGTGIKVNP
jgi:hypothetical protein